MERKYSEMSEVELRDEALETRDQMIALLKGAEAEKRDLNDEEKKKNEELRQALSTIEQWQVARQRSIAFVEGEKKDPVEVRHVHDVFGENLRSALKEKRHATIEVRDSTAIMADQVKDTVPVLFKDVIEALTPALIIEKIGVKAQFGVQGQPVWPTVGDVEATWEGEGVALEDKAIAFGALKANPHRMGLSISLTNRALYQSNLQLYNIVVRKIARSFAALLNKTLVSFTQVNNKAPKGVFITPAADPVSLSAYPTLKEVVSLETKVMDQNIELDADGFGAYIVSTAMRGKLKTTPIEPGSPKMLLEDNMMNGYPVVATNYMATDAIGFGFFEYAVITQFGDMRFTFDPVTGALKDEVKFIGNTEADITAVRPEAFVVGIIDDIDDIDGGEG